MWILGRIVGAIRPILNRDAAGRPFSTTRCRAEMHQGALRHYLVLAV